MLNQAPDGTEGHRGPVHALRALAHGSAQVSHGDPIFVEQQAHRDGVGLVGLVCAPVREEAGETADSLHARGAHVTLYGTVAQDAYELREQLP